MDQRHHHHQQQQQQGQQHHQPMQTGIGGAVANSSGGNAMMGDANANPAPQGLVDPTPRKEIYTYTAPWTVFAMAWSRRYVCVDCVEPRLVCCVVFRSVCLEFCCVSCVPVVERQDCR